MANNKMVSEPKANMIVKTYINYCRTEMFGEQLQNKDILT